MVADGCGLAEGAKVPVILLWPEAATSAWVTTGFFGFRPLVETPRSDRGFLGFLTSAFSPSRAAADDVVPVCASDSFLAVLLGSRFLRGFFTEAKTFLASSPTFSPTP